MLAEKRGVLQVSVTPAGGACAWVGDPGAMVPVEWPDGWTAVFTPTPQIVDSSGRTVGVAGEQINVGGGFGPAKVAQCGASVGDLVFLVEGPAPLG